MRSTRDPMAQVMFCGTRCIHLSAHTSHRMLENHMRQCIVRASVLACFECLAFQCSGSCRPCTCRTRHTAMYSGTQPCRVGRGQLRSKCHIQPRNRNHPALQSATLTFLPAVSFPSLDGAGRNSYSFQRAAKCSVLRNDFRCKNCAQVPPPRNRPQVQNTTVSFPIQIQHLLSCSTAGPPTALDISKLLGHGSGLHQQLFELAAGVHLHHDVATTNEFAINIELRDGGPVSADRVGGAGGLALA